MPTLSNVWRGRINTGTLGAGRIILAVLVATSSISGANTIKHWIFPDPPLPVAFTGTFTWSRDTVVDQQMVVPLEKNVATDVTSIIGCAVMTGAGAALNAAQVRPGNSVVIIGAGGVEKIIDLRLNAADKKAFDESLNHVKDIVQAMNRVLGAA